MPAELKSGFLVAAPSLLDPNFRGAVVLLVQHQKGGSLGFVVNRPSRVDFLQISEELGLSKDGEKVSELQVFEGGPVAQHTGWLIFDKSEIEAPDENVLRVGDNLCISTSLELLESMAQAEGSARRFLVLGYAGWAPGQLDEEIKDGAWIPVDLDDSILFDTPIPERWNRALGLLGIDPRQLVGVPPAQN